MPIVDRRLAPRKLEPEEEEVRGIREEVELEWMGMTPEQYRAQQEEIISDLLLLEWEEDQRKELEEYQAELEYEYDDNSGYYDDDDYYECEKLWSDPPEKKIIQRKDAFWRGSNQ